MNMQIFFEWQEIGMAERLHYGHVICTLEMDKVVELIRGDAALSLVRNDLLVNATFAIAMHGPGGSQKAVSKELLHNFRKFVTCVNELSLRSVVGEPEPFRISLFPSC